MHVSDALVSPAVSGVALLVSAVLLAVAVKKVKRDAVDRVVPLMGVMGAFVFALQMINFSIPGTGSSGHVVGGVFLAALLGPWAAFITLTSVLVIQCVVFADGGVLALGCNVLNMAAASTLVAYPLVFRPLVRGGWGVRGWTASVMACVVADWLGAFMVSVETEASGVTALPWGHFVILLLFIHLFIGLGEGLATAALLAWLRHYRPGLLVQLDQMEQQYKSQSRSYFYVLYLLLVAFLLALSFKWLASGLPDGLEWAVQKLTDGKGASAGQTMLHELTARVQRWSAVFADYDSTLSGLIGVLIVLLVMWLSSFVFFRKKRGE